MEQYVDPRRYMCIQAHTSKHTCAPATESVDACICHSHCIIQRGFWGALIACNNTTCNECFYKVLESSSRTHLCCRKIRATTTCTEHGHVRHSEVSDCDTHGRHVGIDAPRWMAEVIDSSLKLRLNGGREQHLQPLSYAYIHKLWQLRLCDEKVRRGMTTSFRFLSQCSLHTRTT